MRYDDEAPHYWECDNRVPDGQPVAVPIGGDSRMEISTVVGCRICVERRGWRPGRPIVGAACHEDVLAVECSSQIVIRLPDCNPMTDAVRGDLNRLIDPRISGGVGIERSGRTDVRWKLSLGIAADG